MKTAISMLVIALLLAGLLTATASTAPFGDRLLRLEAQWALPAMSTELANESPAIHAVFVSYADEPALWMSARLALLRHGPLARRALTDFGSDPAFQRVLMRYGADAVLPVVYYRDHDLTSLRLQQWLGTQYRAASERLDDWWPGSERSPTADETPGAEASPTLSPQRRGQIAIAILARQGHGFLDQFVVDPQGKIQWLQSERLISGLNDFFTGGLRDLESQWRQGEPLGVTDIGWAGVDLLVMASAVKVLRAGRLVRASAAVEGQSARVAASEVIAGGGRFANLSRAAKVAAVAGTAYVVVRHPSLVSALGATMASWLGWPAWLGQFLVWALVLMPLLVMARFAYRWLVAPVLWLLVPLLRATSHVPRWMRERDAARQRPTSAGGVIE
ncbi:hypothetical protein [Salinicola avicenniae]|uniref:hypothetical protein n=1 Tax=Salinicola avicenniae TaxID=2916836 RepID=UPI002072C93A|nr:MULTISPECIES: hypothetical protein [unclassified Salinicola]